MKKEHLFSITKKDLEIDYFSGRGAGGQSRNKNQNCVRIRHRDSGAIATGQSNKSRKANTKEAFDGLVKNTKFKVWHSMKVHEALTGKSLDDIVKGQLIDENLKVEVRGDKGWEEFGK